MKFKKAQEYKNFYRIFPTRKVKSDNSKIQLSQVPFLVGYAWNF